MLDDFLTLDQQRLVLNRSPKPTGCVSVPANIDVLMVVSDLKAVPFSCYGGKPPPLQPVASPFDAISGVIAIKLDSDFRGLLTRLPTLLPEDSSAPVMRSAALPLSLRKSMARLFLCRLRGGLLPRFVPINNPSSG